MLLASWTFYTILKGFRSFNAENVGSVGQRAANLPAIKVWEWFDPGPPRTRADWFECGRGRMADFFVRPPTLTTGNFEAIWPKDLKTSGIKVLNRFKKYAKYQEASSILWVGFALSKWSHLHRAYVVTMPFILILAVHYTIVNFCNFYIFFIFYVHPLWRVILFPTSSKYRKSS